MGRPGMAGPAHDRIVVAAPHVVDARFQLHEIVAMPAAFGRRVPVADDAAERKSTLDAAAAQRSNTATIRFDLQRPSRRSRGAVPHQTYRECWTPTIPT